MELFEVGRQRVTVTFDGGDVVSDAGLLPMRELGILAEAARRLPDPRSQMFVTHSAERMLTQQVYQILAGDPDGNDAQLLRDDPLFKRIAGSHPRAKDLSLASGSTINRFHHVFTRPEAEKPLEDRDVIFEVRRAQTRRFRARGRVSGGRVCPHAKGAAGARHHRSRSDRRSDARPAAAVAVSRIRQTASVLPHADL